MKDDRLCFLTVRQYGLLKNNKTILDFLRNIKFISNFSL